MVDFIDCNRNSTHRKVGNMNQLEVSGSERAIKKRTPTGSPCKGSSSGGQCGCVVRGRVLLLLLTSCTGGIIYTSNLVSGSLILNKIMIGAIRKMRINKE